jgi:hypothetical protein
VLQTGAVMILAAALLVSGCGGLFGDRMPDVVNPAQARRVTIEVVARDNRCEPGVIAVDRLGRAVMIIFQVTSVGKEHRFLIPDLSVRRRVPPDSREEIQILADRSGVYEYACTSQPWIGPFATPGKLAIK